ncbi:btb/poz domain-containing protein [Anaeramoeba flamelloides]|uniref:Btb/poz domain-containing protein n=1 Tax=Anaeramoeba flamelloides TaxID=1746091 RepID=A0ABQ8XQY9_9EUKA|nr:btb/poz domain-containing protein [Anaeramoeba flamelloides]
MKVTPIFTKLQPFINNAKLADVMFHVGKDKVEMYGHRFVLAINSKYLSNLFYSKIDIQKQTKKKYLLTIALPNIEPKPFLSILEFCYLRKTKISKKNAFQVLNCSKKFGLKELQQLCLNFLIQNINNQNALKVYQTLVQYQQKNSAQTAYKYILHNKPVLRTSNCFVGLKNQTIESILKSNQIYVNENHISKRVTESLVARHSTKSVFITKSVNENRNSEKQPTRRKSKVSDEEKKGFQKNLGSENGRSKKKSKTKERDTKLDKFFENSETKEFHEFSSTNEMFNTVLISKLTEICDNSTIYHTSVSNEELWLETDLLLMGKVTNAVGPLSLARCLTEQWAEIVDESDIRLLDRIEWQRFLNKKYVKKLLKTGLFDKEKLNLFLAYLISNGDLSIVGGEGVQKVEQNLTRSRKEKIKRSQIKVLLIAAQDRRKRRKDVLRSIKSTGISHVSDINLCEKTPSLLELKKHDVVFLYSLTEFRSPTKLGNLLADFVDNGGSVVVSTINCLRNDCNDKRELRGRFVEQDYLPIQRGKECGNERRKLGKVYQKNHHILNEVKKFDGGGNSWHIEAEKVTKDSKIVAKYDNGNIMIAEKCLKNRGKVIVLNFFPVSDSVRHNDEYWNISTDGHKIIANSIEYAYQN